ncbi:exported hypothetical protein [uncultured Paludibacter sp.]|nr:exported hypothetical protein [uncultured Paludibacter sp.]
MKKLFLFLIMAFTLGFLSCNLGDGYSENTPSIFFNNPAKLNSDSLLYFKNTSDINIVRIDSLHVGDTLKISVIMNAYYNQLTEFDYNVNDSTAIKTQIPDSLKGLFKSLNYKTGRFLFNNNYSLVVLPVDLIALKSSDSIAYTFGVYSDVTKITNMALIGLKTKIKP